jgi:hypothetical protein
MGRGEKKKRDGNIPRSNSDPSIDVVVAVGNGDTPPRQLRIAVGYGCDSARDK